MAPTASEAARPHAPGSLSRRRALGGAHAEAGGGAGARSLPVAEPGCARRRALNAQAPGGVGFPPVWPAGWKGASAPDTGEVAIRDKAGCGISAKKPLS